MIKKAEEKKEHVSLYVGKLVTCIDALDAQYDLFISADVLILQGPWKRFLKAVKTMPLIKLYLFFLLNI